MSSNTRRSRFILLVIAGWIFYALFFGIQSYLSGRFFGREVWFVGQIVGWLICAVIWMIFTPIALKIAQRFPFERGRLKVSIPVHLIAGVIFSVATLGIYTLVWLKLSGLGVSFLEMWKTRLVTDFHFFLLLYFALIGLYQLYDYYSRFREQERRALQLEVDAAQLETQLAHAQLDALKMQIHPHFLFNTLNSISVLMSEDPRAANEMLLRLSELLRTTLKSEATQVVPLRQELDFLRDYLAIEQTRFQDRLTVRFDVDDDSLDASVPNLILQPLVENAIRHGIAHRADAGIVEIRARRNNDFVDLSVSDNGNGASAPLNTNGIGLRNSRARLEKLYGGDYKFEVINGDGGFRVEIQIPYTKKDGEEDTSSDSRR